jgi:FKBP12-rapamycin complex-associated protein
VNTLLQKNDATEKKNLEIITYPVIPLSTNSGILGWVQNCDTIQVLISDYRIKNQILPKAEKHLKDLLAPNYDMLPIPNKVEIFRQILENSKGDDLKKILWINSQNAEKWLEKRTNYSRSLATMSMVGYILGLGDRHLSNLMMERASGKIVHIDFGDCFEVTRVREKFPEKVPFRLTRVLINAMESCGIEGNYRFTCEAVMQVIRENRESIMAILEAFIWDPLLNWK